MPFCNTHQHAYVKVCTQCVMDKLVHRLEEPLHKPTGSYLPRDSASKKPAQPKEPQSATQR